MNFSAIYIIEYDPYLINYISF